MIGHIAECRDNLQTMLTDDQKKMLEKFNDQYDELMVINEREIFVYAFRLGARIATEIMSFGIE